LLPNVRQPGRQCDRLCRARAGRSAAPTVWARRRAAAAAGRGRELELMCGQQLEASHYPHLFISGTRWAGPSRCAPYPARRLATCAPAWTAGNPLC